MVHIHANLYRENRYSEGNFIENRNILIEKCDFSNIIFPEKRSLTTVLSILNDAPLVLKK